MTTPPRHRQRVVLPRFGDPDVMELVREPLPEPAPGEVVVEVEAIGVNFADTMVRRGEYRRHQPPTFTPGFETVGRVVDRGAETDVPIGTKVAAFTEDGGGYASHVVLPEHRVYPLAEDTSGELAAALFLQGVTAALAVRRYGRVRAGDRVLVLAAGGGLGGLAIQLARIDGATVVGAASTAAKLEVARRRGADHVVLGDPATLAADVRERTGGHGCDVVIDGVGGELFEPALRALADRGRYVVVGSASQAPATLDVRRLMPRAQTVLGFIVAQVAAEDPAEPARTLDHLCRLATAGLLHVAYERLPLADAAEAHRRIESRTQTGKLVLVP